MNQKTTYNLLFLIRKSKILKNKKCPISIRITINNERIEFVSKCQVDPNIYDNSACAALGKTKEAKIVNEFIQATRYRFQSIVNEMILNGELITPVKLKNQYLGIKEESKTILEVFADHNKKVKALEGIQYASETRLRYETCYRHIQKCIKTKYGKSDLDLRHITHQFLSDLEFYIKSKIGCNHNTTMKYLKNFKKITRIAMNNGWLKADPFVNFKLTLNKVQRDFLTDIELNAIIDKHFSIHRLEQVKDCFLFACFTGLAYSDLKRLRKDNIILYNNTFWINIKRKKTNTQSNIPLLPFAKSIIEKYKDHPEVEKKNVLLPVLSNQKMNAYLKEIGDLCKITKKLTSHVARHTFATTITLNNDVPIESVSKMLGHSSLEMTKIYAKLLDKKVGRDMKKLSKRYSVN